MCQQTAGLQETNWRDKITTLCNKQVVTTPGLVHMCCYISEPLPAGICTVLLGLPHRLTDGATGQYRLHRGTWWPQRRPARNHLCHSCSSCMWIASITWPDIVYVGTGISADIQTDANRHISVQSTGTPFSSCLQSPAASIHYCSC